MSMRTLELDRVGNPDVDLNALDVPIWGIKAIARIANLTPRKAQYALQNGRLDADRYGCRYVSTPRRLLDQFAGASKSRSTRIEADQHVGA
jgi:hypothetical protein